MTVIYLADKIIFTVSCVKIHLVAEVYYVFKLDKEPLNRLLP